MRFRAACVTVALLALVAAAVGGAAEPKRDGPCTIHVYPGLEPSHLTSLNAKPKYNSFPPTSGPHYQYPARFDIYTFPVPQIALVHNLEHGGIVVQYGSKVPKKTVAQIRRWYLRHTNGLVVAPLPALGRKIALGAWNAPPYKQSVPVERQDPGHGYLAICTAFSDGAFTRFVRRHEYKGGERFPKAALARNR